MLEDFDPVKMISDIDLEMAETNRLRRPDVPGFWPSNGFVAISLTGKDMKAVK